MTRTLQPGVALGGHHLLVRIGAGGMGEVWAAAKQLEDAQFQKLVALKVVAVEALSSNDALMFYDEARVAARLEHNAIVRTLDLGNDGGLLYIAMECVEGPSLHRIMREEEVMPDIVIAHVGARIASALEYAYDRAEINGAPLRLVHRDVTPHNILVDTHGSVRLSDFGVARSTHQLHRSAVGTLRGKPGYMSPEQIRGETLDARSDLFSLGVVMHELASGRRLFQRETPMEAMRAVLEEAAPPLPRIDGALREIIERCLERNPNDRWSSASELRGALERFLFGRPDKDSVETLIGRLASLHFPDALRLARAGVTASSSAADDDATGVRNKDDATRSQVRLPEVESAGQWPPTPTTSELAPTEIIRAPAPPSSSLAPAPPTRSPAARWIAVIGLAVGALWWSTSWIDRTPLPPPETVTETPRVITPPVIQAHPAPQESSEPTPLPESQPPKRLVVRPLKRATAQASEPLDLKTLSALVRQVKEIDEVAAKSLYADLGEAGDDQARLRSIRDRALVIMSKRKP